MDLSPSAAGFGTTRWSVVLAAGSSDAVAETALERLCRAYWPPIYAFVRRRGHAPSDAQDLTQGFFALLLQREFFADADPHRGRFRTFLLSALTCFLADEQRHATRQKRGGGVVPISLNDDTAEAGYLEIPSPELSPDALFDRRWRLALLQLALDRLEDEFVTAGKSRQFALLKEFLTGPATAGAYEPIARELGLSSRTIAVTIHRMRQRFREAVREEVAQTVSNSVEFDEEINLLFGPAHSPAKANSSIPSALM